MRVDLKRAGRDGAIAALIAFGLFLPLIGFNTVLNIHNELILETRWPLLAIMVAIIAAGRFLHSLLIVPWRERAARRSRPDGERAWMRYGASWLTPFTLGFAIFYPACCPVARRLSGRGEMDRQFRGSDSDLCDAGLGPQHRRRARGPARPGVCRVLRGRRLFLRAVRQSLRFLVLDVVADWPAASPRHGG